MSRQFLIFLLAGGIAAAVNFCSRILYNDWMNFSAAIVLAYATGMVAAFILGKLFVFRDSRQPLHHAAVFFVLVNLVGVVQTWAISMVLAYYALPALGMTLYVREIAHGIGLAVPAFTSYIGHKHLSFR